MKQCTQCLQLLDESSFFPISKTNPKLRSRCRKCECEYGKQYRAAHREQYNEYGRKRRAENRKLLYEGKVCSNCGATENLRYHHINPDEKEFGIANKLGCNIEWLREELEKCILVCEHCHSLIHEREKNFKDTIYL